MSLNPVKGLKTAHNSWLDLLSQIVLVALNGTGRATSISDLGGVYSSGKLPGITQIRLQRTRIQLKDMTENMNFVCFFLKNIHYEKVQMNSPHHFYH